MYLIIKKDKQGSNPIGTWELVNSLLTQIVLQSKNGIDPDKIVVKQNFDNIIDKYN